MAEKWFDELPEDAFSSESEKVYMAALKAVKAGLTKGYDFDSASATVDIQDEQLRQTVLDDVLKVIIAEEHFTKKIPLDQINAAIAQDIVGRRHVKKNCGTLKVGSRDRTVNFRVGPFRNVNTVCRS